MSLGDFIEKIQNKPRHVRVQILWVSVFILMSVVVTGWIFSMAHTLETAAQEESERFSKPEQVKEVPSLFDSLKSSVSSLFEQELNKSSDQNQNQNQSGSQDLNNILEENNKNRQKNSIESDSKSNPPAMLPIK